MEVIPIIEPGIPSRRLHLRAAFKNSASCSSIEGVCQPLVERGVLIIDETIIKWTSGQILYASSMILL